MQAIWPLVLLFFLAATGCSWAYFIARTGRGWGWRVGLGVTGAILWPVLGAFIDRPVYLFMRRILGLGHEDWEGVLGVYFVSAVLVALVGLVITQMIPRPAATSPAAPAQDRQGQ